jgi:hypothetical protein
VELYRRKHYQAAFCINTWYDALKEHTFRSRFLDFSVDEARALIAKNRTPEEIDIISKLQGRIDDEIKKNFVSKGCFVKLDTRSPKDVPIYDFSNQRLIDLIQQQMAKSPKEQQSLNYRTVAFVKATNKVMKISSGAEALDLLERSDRIRQDISKQIEFGDHLFGLKIVLREWLEEVSDRPEYEFRAFVHKGQLNALTMYFCFYHSKELQDNIATIVPKIRAFHDSIKSKIIHSSYVIDFYAASDGSIKIIELNPFHIGAGAGLFDWKTDRDLFFNGPFEYRIVEKVPEEVGEEIPLKWQRWLNDRYGITDDDKERLKKKQADLAKDGEDDSFLGSISPVTQALLIGGLVGAAISVAVVLYRSRYYSKV